MKKKFEKPRFEIIEFEQNDIISTSGELVQAPLFGGVYAGAESYNSFNNEQPQY